MKEMICVECPNGCRIQIEEPTGKVSGNKCPRGITYAQTELNHPRRILTTTVTVTGGIYPRLPVKSTIPINRELLLPAVQELRRITVAAPVQAGQIILENALGTGADIVATRSMVCHSQQTEATLS